MALDPGLLAGIVARQVSSAIPQQPAPAFAAMQQANAKLQAQVQPAVQNLQRTAQAIQNREGGWADPQMQAPKPYTPDPMMMAQARQNQVGNLITRRQNDLTNLLGTLKNPYQRGGTAYTAAMNDAVSRPSGMLQNALLSNQRSLAERGITADSGLAQQADSQARIEAAKQAAAFGGQVAQDFSNREADYDRWRAGFEADQRANLASMEAGLLDRLAQQDWAGFDRMAQQEERNYGRRLDAQLDPYRVSDARLGVEGKGYGVDLSRLEAQYPPQFAAQRLAGGQQALDTGAINLSTMRQLQPSEIAARQAQNQYQTADYGGQMEEIRRTQEMMNSPYGSIIRGSKR